MENNKPEQFIRAALLVIFLALVSGCATTQTENDFAVTSDPLEPPNRVFFEINETIDKHLLKPVAEAYLEVTPEPVRARVTNFFDNITYLNVILHALLQGKIDQALSDATRFLFNSTIGIAGLFDVSTAMGLPKHDEDFGQTLAVWGFDQGAYLYIPLQGPNTVRNVPNYATSILLNPLTYITSTVLFPLTAVNAINTRANLLDETSIRDEAALDPYTFTREAYLQQRNYLIYDGNPPAEGYDDIFDEEITGGDEEGVLVIE